MKITSGLSTLAVMLFACLFVVLTAPSSAVGNPPPWERLLEPAEPDTEAIARAAEPQTPQSEVEAEPVLTEQEQKVLAQKEAQEAKAAQNAQRKAEREERAAEKRQVREARAAQKRASREARNTQRNADREAREVMKAEISDTVTSSADAGVTASEPSTPVNNDLPDGADYDLFADHAALPTPEPAKPENIAPAVETAKPEEPEQVVEAAMPTESAPPAPVAAPEPEPTVETAVPAEPASLAAVDPAEPEPAEQAETEDSEESATVSADNEDQPDELTESETSVSAAPARSAQRPMMERSKAPPKGGANAPATHRAPKEPRTVRPGGFGIRAGIGVGGLGGHKKTDELAVAGSSADTIKLGVGVSASVGLVYTQEISENMSMAVELQYSLYMAYGEHEGEPRQFTDSDGSTRSSPFSPLYEAAVELHTMELPVMLRFNLGESAYMELGPQFGVNIYTRLDVSGSAYKANIKGLAFGPTFGAGVKICQLSMGLRAHIGVVEYVEDMGGRPWSIQFSAMSEF